MKLLSLSYLNLEALHGIANVVLKLTGSLNSSTDLKAKKKRAETIIQCLDNANQYPECREVFENYDALYEQTKSMLLVTPVINHLNKAHKFRFKKKDASEKNALLDAMYEIDQNNITDDDFNKLGSFDEETGEIISISQIEKRLKELGWKR